MYNVQAISIATCWQVMAQILQSLTKDSITYIFEVR